MNRGCGRRHLLTWVAAAAAPLFACAPAERGKKGKQSVTDFPPHPGTIRMTDEFAGTVREVPAAEVPEPNRFVYLKNGVETADAKNADERIPIVEVRMMPLDANGNLVSRDKAAKIVIQEYGPGQRPLRRSTMVKD